MTELTVKLTGGVKWVTVRAVHSPHGRVVAVAGRQIGGVWIVEGELRGRLVGHHRVKRVESRFVRPRRRQVVWAEPKPH